MEAGWGTREFNQALADEIFPTRSDDPAFVESYWRLIRHSITKADALANDRMFKDTDVRHVLPTIQAPALVMHNLAIHDIPGAAEESRYIASRIPGAVFAETDPRGEDIWEGAFPAIDQFLASLRAEEAAFDRVLATVMFTDIVDSTAQGAALGDHAWRELRAQHDQIVRANLGRYRGREIKTMGDGFLATFDGPARGVRCAEAIVAALQPLGIEIRAGLHTGEVAFEGDDVAGLGVAIGARVGALAGPSEVLVSSTVKDLVAGSGLDVRRRRRARTEGHPRSLASLPGGRRERAMTSPRVEYVWNDDVAIAYESWARVPSTSCMCRVPCPT